MGNGYVPSRSRRPLNCILEAFQRGLSVGGRPIKDTIDIVKNSQPFFCAGIGINKLFAGDYIVAQAYSLYAGYVLAAI